jgi:hypothetical protein
MSPTTKWRVPIWFLGGEHFSRLVETQLGTKFPDGNFVPGLGNVSTAGTLSLNRCVIKQ